MPAKSLLRLKPAARGVRGKHRGVPAFKRPERKERGSRNYSPPSAARNISSPGPSAYPLGRKCIRRRSASKHFYLRAIRRERIAAKLGHPEFDPHGHAIPAPPTALFAQVTKPRDSLTNSNRARQPRSKVSSDKGSRDAALYLATQGIRPGVQNSPLANSCPSKGGLSGPHWELRPSWAPSQPGPSPSRSQSQVK